MARVLNSRVYVAAEESFIYSIPVNLDGFLQIHQPRLSIKNDQIKVLLLSAEEYINGQPCYEVIVQQNNTKSHYYMDGCSALALQNRDCTPTHFQLAIPL